jgi:hypothetical protein
MWSIGRWYLVGLLVVPFWTCGKGARPEPDSLQDRTDQAARETGPSDASTRETQETSPASDAADLPGPDPSVEAAADVPDSLTQPDLHDTADAPDLEVSRPREPPPPTARVVALLFNGCAGEACATCSGSFCTAYGPEVFDALIATDATLKEFPGQPRILCTNPVAGATLPPTSALILLETPLPADACPAPW